MYEWMCVGSLVALRGILSTWGIRDKAPPVLNDGLIFLLQPAGKDARELSPSLEYQNHGTRHLETVFLSPASNISAGSRSWSWSGGGEVRFPGARKLVLPLTGTNLERLEETGHTLSQRRVGDEQPAHPVPGRCV